MNAHFESTHSIEISPGELIQVLGSSYAKCHFQLVSGRNKKATSRRVIADNKLCVSKSWPVKATDTVASIVERWLADVPVRSPKKIAQTLGLDKKWHTSVLKLNHDAFLRLNTLRAMLDGAEVLEFMSLESIADFTGFLKGIRSEVLSSLETEHYNPAFVVYGAEGSPGVSFMADRVLEVDGYGVREVEVELW